MNIDFGKELSIFVTRGIGECGTSAPIELCRKKETLFAPEIIPIQVPRTRAGLYDNFMYWKITESDE